MSKIGHISIHRRMQDNPLWTLEPFTKAQAWIDILLSTNHTAGYIELRNGEIVHLKRGECGTSMLTLASRWKWSRGKVKRFLNFLISQKMIQQKNIPQTTVFKVLNYEKYQSGTTNSTTNRQQTVQQTDSKQYTKNNDNNDNNDNNVSLCAENKKNDFFINPIKTHFENEYKRIIGNSARMTRSCCEKLYELAENDKDFNSTISECLEMFKQVKFNDINFTPTHFWLLKDDNFMRVLSGEFKPKLTKEQEYAEKEKRKRERLKAWAERKD